MKGAIIGDIVGSRFEFDPYKGTDFALFGGDGINENTCQFTDDTIMTVAIADGLLKCDPKDRTHFSDVLIDSIHNVAWPYLYEVGFGIWQYEWLKYKKREPFNSFGNGAAMRVSPAGWYSDSLEDTLVIATQVTEITHNHPEGIKAAQAVAACIWMARNGISKDLIKEVVNDEFYPEAFQKPLSSIRPQYDFDVTCQGSVPISIQCFLEADSFEETIRLAVSMGGDSDTMAAIAGSIAEAYYGIPDELWGKAKGYLSDDIASIVETFYEQIVSNACGCK